MIELLKPCVDQFELSGNPSSKWTVEERFDQIPVSLSILAFKFLLKHNFFIKRIFLCEQSNVYVLGASVEFLARKHYSIKWELSS